MDNWLFLVIIPLLGLIFGYILRKIAPEELKQGEKYFLFLRKILLFIIVILLIDKISLSLPIILVFLAGMIPAVFLRLRYLYLGLAIVSALQFPHERMLLILAIICIYGLPFGTQKITNHPAKTIIIHTILYLLPLLILLLPQGIFLVQSQWLPVFAAGALFLRE